MRPDLPMTSIPTIAEITERVDAELHTVLDSRRMPLYRMMSYHLGWEDAQGEPGYPGARDRNHGVACLVACHGAGGDLDIAAPAAASVELTNGFSEVHDDVQGGNPERFGRDAVWWTWGPAQAINAGDGMHALARLAIFRLEERGVPPETTFGAVQTLDEASLALCEGRFQDLEAQERIDLSVDAYMEMAARKTGALYACAMRLGAMVVGAEDLVVDAMRLCGASLGVAAQIRGDLSELWPEDDDAAPSPEVLNKKKLLPVVYAVEKANIHTKRRFGDIYFKRVLEPDDVTSLRQLLEEQGARDYCRGLVARRREEAAGALDAAGFSADGAAVVESFAGALLGD